MGQAAAAGAGSAAGGIFGSLIQGLFDQRNQRFAANYADDAAEEAWARLESMFPFSNMISENAMDLYGNNWGQIEDYLRHPTPPSNLERQLFEFFGGQVPEKGYYRTGEGKKGGPGALANRLLGRYGAGESGPLAGQGPILMGEASDLLRSLIPYGQEWGEGGFKTDIQPIQDYAMRMFGEMIPKVAERFGGNIQGSGFQGEMGRTMGDVASELGAMEVMLNEAAAQRRMQGLSGPIQNLFTGPMNLETAFATAAAQAGQNYMDRVNAARPGAALLGALPTFAQIDQGQGFIQQGFPTSGTDYGNVMAGLGSTASGIGSSLGSILDAWLKNRNQNSSGGNSGFSTWTDWGGMNTGSDNSLVGSWTNYGTGGDSPTGVTEMGSLYYA